jgi:hypothetical protein
LQLVQLAINAACGKRQTKTMPPKWKTNAISWRFGRSDTRTKRRIRFRQKPSSDLVQRSRHAYKEMVCLDAASRMLAQVEFVGTAEAVKRSTQPKLLLFYSWDKIMKRTRRCRRMSRRECSNCTQMGHQVVCPSLSDVAESESGEEAAVKKSRLSAF